MDYDDFANQYYEYIDRFIEREPFTFSDLFGFNDNVKNEDKVDALIRGLRELSVSMKQEQEQEADFEITDGEFETLIGV